MRKFLIQFVEKPPGRWFVFAQKDKWLSGSTLSSTLCLPLSHSFQHFLIVFLINFHTLFCLLLPRSFQHFGILVSFHILFCVLLLGISQPIHHCLWHENPSIMVCTCLHFYNATVQGYNCTDSLWIIWMSVQNCPHGMIQGPIKNWSNIDNLIRCAKTC